MKHLLAIALSLGLPTLAAAHDVRLGDLEIIHPYIFATAPTAKAAGGYVTISNDGAQEDALIAVSAPFPKVALHRSVEQDGVMRMQPVERVDIPAGETVELAPGGHHIMFMGLAGPLAVGDAVPVRLRFEKAGEIEVNFTVVAREGGMDPAQMDHSKMDHSKMAPSTSD
ncbi:MAG: copper chaperone PCu(A)C [Roseovarius sp.]